VRLSSDPWFLSSQNKLVSKSDDYPSPPGGVILTLEKQEPGRPILARLPLRHLPFDGCPRALQKSSGKATCLLTGHKIRRPVILAAVRRLYYCPPRSACGPEARTIICVPASRMRSLLPWTYTEPAPAPAPPMALIFVSLVLLADSTLPSSSTDFTDSEAKTLTICAENGPVRPFKVIVSKSSDISVRPVIRPARSILAM